MKKIILAISLFAVVSFSANAQKDGFFTSSYNYEENRQNPSDEEWGTLPSLFSHGLQDDQNAEAPVGSGLLILAGLGVAYAMRKKN